MAHTAPSSLVRQLGSLFDGGTAAGLSDRQLLDRFNAGRDAIGEAAFAVLVARHGPMVLGVCRQLLGDRHHAEDVFQAVFLVLARKARSLREPDLLGNWLYGVTLRTARKARGRHARRRKTEADGAVRETLAHGATAVEQAALERERAVALHCEIDRLPSSFRWAVVLCYFECLTLDEAAHRLRWPVGTLRSRLARARQKLRRGLLRRGMALSAPALAALLTPRFVSASLSPRLCDTTASAARAFVIRCGASRGITGSAVALAREVVRTMLFHKLRVIAKSLLLLAALAAGAGFWGRSLEMVAAPKSPPDAQPAPVLATRDDSAELTTPGRMIVVGRVLDPQGNAVPDASVMVYGANKQGAGNHPLDALAPSALGQIASDRSGVFRIDAYRTSSATHDEVGAAALAPGYGVGWVDLDRDADQPAADITLRPEQVIEGRLFDLQGRSAQGVSISVEGMGLPSRSPDSIPYQVEGPVFWGGNLAKDLPSWPRPAITDAEGRFTIHGTGRNLRIRLVTEHPRFARQRVVVDTDNLAGPKTLTMAMEPAKVISGRVTYADTGKPCAHAVVDVSAYRGGAGYSHRFESDADGQYRANPLSADRYSVSVYPPAGARYLNVSTEIFAWTKGSLERRVDLVLSRGTVIHGTVTEEGSGRPVAGALLGHVGRPPGEEDSGAWNRRAETGPDGSFQLVVLPKAGTLLVLGPSEDYVFQETSERMIRENQPGGRRWYAHAFIDCDLKSGSDSREVNVVLRRGMTVRVRVNGPDGQPVQQARVFSRTITLPQPIPWRSWSGRYHGDVHDGWCSLHGLAPNSELPIFFLEPKQKLGAIIQLSGKAAADELLTVALEPCGLAKARLIDPAGKPLARYRDPWLVSMVVTPGPPRSSRDEADKGRLSADQDYLSRIDPDRYVQGILSDDQGRVTFPDLIAGATYRIYDNDRRGDTGPQLRRELVVKSGEVLELGDIVIAKPVE